MFGRLDVATNDWTDGIFSTLWRKTLKTKKGDHVWLILDGPVDAIWIENLNSVLDDNKTLTLANGDRIPMSPNCKILFEVHNIDNASPATVSRNGMVFMSSSILTWDPILKSWLKTRTDKENEIILPIISEVWPETLTYVNQNLNPKMKVLDCMHIKQMINLLEGIIPSQDSGKIVTSEHLTKMICFSIMWSLGALLELEDRALFMIFLNNNFGKRLLMPQIDEKESLFDYFINDEGEWRHWSERVTEYSYPKEYVPEFTTILIPNVDNIRSEYLMNLIAKQKKPVLFIGEQGTAKTVIIKAYGDKYDPELHAMKGMSFSSATTPYMFQVIQIKYLN